MLRALWKLVQHKYGWAYIENQPSTYQALERRGLVTLGDSGEARITDAGAQIAGDRWPNSPYRLGTYVLPAGGWTPLEGGST